MSTTKPAWRNSFFYYYSLYIMRIKQGSVIRYMKKICRLIFGFVYLLKRIRPNSILNKYWLQFVTIRPIIRQYLAYYLIIVKHEIPCFAYRSAKYCRIIGRILHQYSCNEKNVLYLIIYVFISIFIFYFFRSQR